ncbi:uncharacterized protein BJ171DRAFT_461717, partial [Polychytrium aggregatum]|uniref:uncharacterized protein n=1 Tax=Polychytrium aggregatum TaxID=110093 RepID=UPI0022FE832D
MKITKIPPKRLATAPPWVVALSDQLVSCPQDDLPTLIHSLPEWSHPKGDMFHWIPVLNRFDLVLEAITKPIDSTPASSASILDSELAPESVPIITSILHFTKLLWENCTNRNLYNSYEHLIKLLGTRNIVVLESVLALLIRSAQRISSQRSLKTILTSAHEAVVLLAQRWPSLRAGTAFADIASPDFVPSADLFSLSFQYYQLADPKPTLAVASADARPSATQPDAVSAHKIPLEHQFPLFHRIRTIWGLQSAATRVKMLELRLLALAIFANLTNEEAIQTKILLYEPDLITQLAALLKSDSFVGKPLQCAAMHALDGLARHRAKMNEVLAALNASANHGILMSLVKKITTGHTDDQSPSRELADAVLSLVTHVSTTQTGGNLMISGGLIQALTDVLSITDPG